MKTNLNHGVMSIAALYQLGAYLQRHREERGWSLEEVEALTRIRRRYLQAMETGEWDDLPPGVYTRGLLRNYAHTLGVSVAGVLRMYAKERPHEARLPEPQLISRPLTSEPRLSFELVLAGILLVVAVGLIAWVLGTQLPAYLDAARGWDLDRAQTAQRAMRRAWAVAALACAVAENFSATTNIASLIGESEPFHLNYYEGAQHSIYSAQLQPDIFLMVIFGLDSRSGVVLYAMRHILPRLQQAVS